jgi:hypothetical protein
MKVYCGYARLEIPETAKDLERTGNSAAVLVIAAPKGKATRFEFYGGNGGAYGVEIMSNEEELPDELK